MKIVHIADIHWRGLSRHEEYRVAFKDLFIKAKKLEPDVIYLGGDIVHSKTQGISPELIENLAWMFNNLSKIAPVHVILGNHDGLINNKDRQDAITPIVEALNDPNIFLYKDSGSYPIPGNPGFTWNVLSCFDEENWDRVEPVEGDVNIALFHGAVYGSKTDTDWSIEGEASVSLFDKFDFGLLGDIHKRQFLNKAKTIAYCGSTVQQNYGEDQEKGFLFWDIKDVNDFECSFHAIEQPHPFVTVEWQGTVTETVEACKKFKNESRFRIKSDVSINPTDITHINNELSHVKNSKEVVYKIDSKSDSFLSEDAKSTLNLNLRDTKVISNLFNDYYSNAGFTDQEKEDLDKLVVSTHSSINRSNRAKTSNKWSIKNISFNNTFGYGNNNFINFENLNGITGIFGKNRSGKSSIVGTIMYCLFNATDRGPLKNVHVINSRKNSCRVKATLELSGKKYCVERKSVKTFPKNGIPGSLTYLSIQEVAEDGTVIRDLSDEQRRSTEKTLRSMIGTSEDFLMTSLSSQGGMNRFINQKSTARKEILTKFLDLEIFSEMEEVAKERSQNLRAQIKNIPDREWDVAIQGFKQRSDVINNQIDEVTDIIAEKRSLCQNLAIDIASLGGNDKEIITPLDVQEKFDILNESRLKFDNSNKKLSELNKNLLKLVEKSEKISSFKSSFPIEEIRSDLKNKNDLERSLEKIASSLERERLVLKNLKKLSKNLEPCSCIAVHKPSCRYVKQSKKHNKQIPDQEGVIKERIKELKLIKKSFSLLVKKDLEESVEKYEKILKRDQEIRFELSSIREKIATYEDRMRLYKGEVSRNTEVYESFKSKCVEGSLSEKAKSIKDRMSKLNKEINLLEASKISKASELGKLRANVESMKAEKESYEKLKKELNTYDALIRACSKKGIPFQLIESYIPRINKEIASILQSSVGFTIELRTESNSNNIDLILNYGDSERIVELGSGMEKMMASLALRVALINISSLPKPDIFIIDEGFGSLDETNISSCSTILKFLKKYFKTILIISHIDAIKDSVDSVLEINKNGKDSQVNYK